MDKVVGNGFAPDGGSKVGKAASCAASLDDDRHLARVFYDNGRYTVASVLRSPQGGFDEEAILRQSRQALGSFDAHASVLRLTIDVDPSDTLLELAVAAEKAGNVESGDLTEHGPAEVELAR